MSISKPEVHPTQLVDLDACPFSYSLVHVKKLPPIDERSQPFLARGTSVHQAIALFYRRLTLTAIPKTLDDSEEFFSSKILEALSDAWTPERYYSDEQERRFRKESVLMLKLFARREVLRWYLLLSEVESRQTAFRQFRPRLSEETLRHVFSEFIFVGTVDAVLSDYGNRRWAYAVDPIQYIVDYKTSKVKKLTVYRSYQFQVLCYALLLWLTKNVVVDYSGVYYLRRGEIFYFPVTGDLLLESSRQMKSLVEKYILSDYYPKSPGPHCRWCGYYAYCKGKISESDYLEMVEEFNIKKDARRFGEE